MFNKWKMYIPFYESTFCKWYDHKLDVLSLTEICLKPDEYIISNKSTTQDYCSKNEPRPKGKGRGVATIYSNIFSISQKTGFKHNSLKLGVGDMTKILYHDMTHFISR